MKGTRHVFEAPEPVAHWPMALVTACGETIDPAHWIQCYDGFALPGQTFNSRELCQKCIEQLQQLRYQYLVMPAEIVQRLETQAWSEI